MICKNCMFAEECPEENGYQVYYCTIDDEYYSSEWPNYECRSFDEECE